MSRQAGQRFFFSIITAQLITFTMCAGNDQDDFRVMKRRGTVSLGAGVLEAGLSPAWRAAARATRWGKSDGMSSS